MIHGIACHLSILRSIVWKMYGYSILFYSSLPSTFNFLRNVIISKSIDGPHLDCFSRNRFWYKSILYGPQIVLYLIQIYSLFIIYVKLTKYYTNTICFVRICLKIKRHILCYWLYKYVLTQSLLLFYLGLLINLK